MLVATSPMRQPDSSNGSSGSDSGFDRQYGGGSWRPGKHGGKNIDVDPYSIVFVSIHGSLEEVP
jgi:hypothetical protein